MMVFFIFHAADDAREVRYQVQRAKSCEPGINSACNRHSGRFECLENLTHRIENTMPATLH
jgi:hypothetical protein